MFMSIGLLHRLRVLRFVRTHSGIAAPCSRGPQRVGIALAFFTLLWCSTGQGYGADNLECPEIGSRSVADLIGDVAGSGLYTIESRVDLPNEINEAIIRLQIANPNISSTDVQNVLVAAYCRVVARNSELSAAAKWDRMRQFENILERQIEANMMPTGALIIANVPLPLDVYRELKRQAVGANQTIAQLMAAILKRAAGQ